MSAPTLNTAGDTTSHRLGCFDYNSGTLLAPVWNTVQYVEDYDLQPDNPVMVDATVFGDGGYQGQDKIATAWQLNVTLNHMSVPGSNPPAYDTTHDYLEAHGVGQLGAANRIQLRMYDFDVNDVSGLITPRGQAYMGFANYSWPGYGSGGTGDARMVQLQFLGKGKINKISHPYPIGGAIPNITSKSPSTGLLDAGGEIVSIFGDHFTGTTGVTIGGTTCKFVVVSDSRIDAVTPAHASGTAAVVVTNATGASTTGGTVSYV